MTNTVKRANIIAVQSVFGVLSAIPEEGDAIALSDIQDFKGAPCIIEWNWFLKKYTVVIEEDTKPPAEECEH